MPLKRGRRKPAQRLIPAPKRRLASEAKGKNPRPEVSRLGPDRPRRLPFQQSRDDERRPHGQIDRRQI
jgi:hypothetical protein